MALGFERDGLTRRRLLASGSAAVAGGVLLQACGGGSARVSSSGGQAAAPTQKGGVLRVGLPGGGSSDSIDPHHSFAIGDYARAFNVYAGLGYLAHGTKDLELKLELAASIESNKTATEWTVRLRPGVKWQDGKTLSADDLIYSVKRVIDPKEAANVAPLFRWVDPNGIKKRDNLTVTFKALYPWSVAKYAFCDLNNRLVPQNYDPRKPIGCGPFKVKSFIPGQATVLEAFDEFWEGRPVLDELQLIDLDEDSARVNALLAGQVDAIAATPPSSLSPLTQSGTIDILEHPAGAFFPFAMNLTKPPFTDVRVRQALRLLANREELLESALFGHGRLGDDLYSPDDPWYDKSLKREVDVEQATSLLKAAGADGSTITLNVTDQGLGTLEAAQIYAQQCSAGGIKLDVKKIDNAAWNANFGNWAFSNSSWNQTFYREQILLSDGPEGAFNETFLGNTKKEFAALAEQLGRETDEGKSAEIATELQKIQFEEGGFIIWGFPNTLSAVTNKTSGYVTDLSGYDFATFNFRKVGFTS